MQEAAKHAVLLAVLALALFPLALVLIVSLKSNAQFTAHPWWFDAPSDWRWSNWAVAWRSVSPAIANSIVCTVGAVALGIALLVPASYALARHEFRGKRLVSAALTGSIFLPGSAATLVTTSTLLDGLGLANSRWALVLCGACAAQVVGIFILRPSIADLPKELFEAAELDGAGHWQQLRHIVLPMTAPVIGTLAIMDFIGNWNSLLLPLVVLRDEDKLTIPVMLMRLDGDYVKRWGELMAGYAIASLPLLVLVAFTMRWFMRGLSSGAVKG